MATILSVFRASTPMGKEHAQGEQQRSGLGQLVIWAFLLGLFTAIFVLSAYFFASPISGSSALLPFYQSQSFGPYQTGRDCFHLAVLVSVFSHSIQIFFIQTLCNCALLPAVYSAFPVADCLRTVLFGLVYPHNFILHMYGKGPETPACALIYFSVQVCDLSPRKAYIIKEELWSDRGNRPVKRSVWFESGELVFICNCWLKTTKSVNLLFLITFVSSDIS